MIDDDDAVDKYYRYADADQQYDNDDKYYSSTVRCIFILQIILFFITLIIILIRHATLYVTIYIPFFLTSSHYYPFLPIYFSVYYFLQNGWTPLHRACENGHESTARVQLENGADPNLQNKVTSRRIMMMIMMLMKDNDRS